MEKERITPEAGLIQEENKKEEGAHKESGVNIVYGDERKRKIIAEKLKRFFDEKGGSGDRFKNEREKSPAAKELIAFLAEEVPEFAREYGATPNDGPTDIAHLAETLTHEMLHFQSFQSLVVNRSGDWSGTERRVGFGTGTRSGKHYFLKLMKRS